MFARDAFDSLGDRPVVRVDMIEELLAWRIHRTPLRETFQPPLVIAPVLERPRRRRNAGGMNQQMLDGGRLFAVAPILRHVLDDLVCGTDFSFLDEEP